MISENLRRFIEDAHRAIRGRPLTSGRHLVAGPLFLFFVFAMFVEKGSNNVHKTMVLNNNDVFDMC